MRAMAERDQLMGSRLQDEKEVSDKKLSLSETKNKQAIRKQAEMKIEELRDVIKTLTIEMAVCVFRNTGQALPLTSCPCRTWKRNTTI